MFRQTQYGCQILSIVIYRSKPPEIYGKSSSVLRKNRFVTWEWPARPASSTGNDTVGSNSGLLTDSYHNLSSKFESHFNRLNRSAMNCISRNSLHILQILAGRCDVRAKEEAGGVPRGRPCYLGRFDVSRRGRVTPPTDEGDPVAKIGIIVGEHIQVNHWTYQCDPIYVISGIFHVPILMNIPLNIPVVSYCWLLTSNITNITLTI